MREFEGLAGRDIDALIAEKVMGWTNVTKKERPWVKGRFNLEGLRPPTVYPSGNTFVSTDPEFVPFYSIDIAAAWTILPKFADFQIESENQTSGWWRVFLDVTRNNGTTYPVCATADRFEDIPLAICRAALIAQDLQERLRNDEVIPGVNPP